MEPGETLIRPKELVVIICKQHRFASRGNLRCPDCARDEEAYYAQKARAFAQADAAHSPSLLRGRQHEDRGVVTEVKVESLLGAGEIE